MWLKKVKEKKSEKGKASFEPIIQEKESFYLTSKFRDGKLINDLKI